MKRIFAIIPLLISGIASSQSSGGSLSSNTVVCQGSNNGVLSVSGFSGSIVRWEYATNPGGPWSSMAFTSFSFNYVNLIQSTWFRTIVQLTGFPEAASNTVSVICDASTIPGTISGPASQCSNSAVSATLSANNGTVQGWEFSIDNWITTNTITASNTLVATINSLVAPTQIRARIRNGVCPVSFSNTLTVIPSPPSAGGNILGSQTLCAGNNNVTISLGGYTGAVQQWEESSAANGPFLPITSSSGTDAIIIFNSSLNTWFRVLVESGACPPAYSSTASIVVNQPPQGGGISGTQSVCANSNSGTLQLIGYSGQITQWQVSPNGISWAGISNTTSALSFSNISNPAIYRATVQNGICPPVNSSTFAVQVLSAPTASFTSGNACRLEATSFSNYSSGNNYYTWNFGDGSGSSIQNPLHSYGTAGTYTVRLLALSASGCADSTSRPVTVYPLPAASFVSADTACYGYFVNFNNSSSISSGSITSVKFYFGDGSFSFANSSPHFYIGSGNYPVSLVAQSGQGCKDSVSRIVKIFPKPDALFSVKNVCKGDPAVFSGSSSVTSGNLLFAWNFGDQQASSLSSPVHNYTAAGSYSVSLLVSTEHNCRDTAITKILIHERPQALVTATDACYGFPVLFGISLTPPVPIATTSVYYGNGTSSFSLSNSFLYSAPGVYGVSVTLKTDSGCVASDFRSVTVHPRPAADFVFESRCLQDTVVFTSRCYISSGAMNYLWNFTGAGSSSLSSPRLRFPSSGNHNVSLLVLSNFGCRDSVLKTVPVSEAPKSQFRFSNSCDGFPVTFTNSSNINFGTIQSYLWDFGDNSTSNAVSPLKTYLNKGNYAVSLIALSDKGCADTAIEQVTVNEAPVADFSSGDQCVNKELHFSNSSVVSQGSFSSYWKFGDGQFSNQDSPGHQYQAPGAYTASLRVVSNNGCIDSVSGIVYAFPLPIVSAGRDTTINKGGEVRLVGRGAKSYFWSPREGLSDPYVPEPRAFPERSSSYIVEGTDAHGCRNEDTVMVIVKDEFVVIPYNIVTPDGNGKNDTWIVKNISAYPENHAEIFDEWNQKVYEKSGYLNEWEGKNIRGEILPDATYYYILKFTGSNKIYSGYITLIRRP